jgi:hypothetical protein
VCEGRPCPSSGLLRASGPSRKPQQTDRQMTKFRLGTVPAGKAALGWGGDRGVDRGRGGVAQKHAGWTSVRLHHPHVHVRRNGHTQMHKWCTLTGGDSFGRVQSFAPESGQAADRGAGVHGPARAAVSCHRKYKLEAWKEYSKFESISRQYRSTRLAVRARVLSWLLTSGPLSPPSAMRHTINVWTKDIQRSTQT